MATRTHRFSRGQWETSVNSDNQWDVCEACGGDMIADLAHCDNAEVHAHLIAAAPDLLAEAHVLRCLATSSRFQTMTVAAALAELRENGCGHDDGVAIAKALRIT